MTVIERGDSFEYLEYETTYVLPGGDTSEHNILSIIPPNENYIYQLFNVNVFMHNLIGKGSFKIYCSTKNWYEASDEGIKQNLALFSLDAGLIYWDPANRQYWVPIYIQDIRNSAIRITWTSLGGEPADADIIIRYTIGNRSSNI